MDGYEVNSYEGLTILSLTHTLRSNCGITLVVRNNASWATCLSVPRGPMCPTCLPMMSEVTCSTVRPHSSASKPEATEMVACPTFMIHMPDESFWHSGHPCECRVVRLIPLC